MVGYWMPDVEIMGLIWKLWNGEAMSRVTVRAKMSAQDGSTSKTHVADSLGLSGLSMLQPPTSSFLVL